MEHRTRSRSHLARLAPGAAALVLLALSIGGCGRDEARSLSLLRVLVEPSEFVRETVAVRGHLGADLRLYATSEHALNFDQASSIEVRDPDPAGGMASRCAEGNAELVGRLRRKRGTPRGSDDPRHYAIERVEAVVKLSPDGRHGRCWPPPKAR